MATHVYCDHIEHMDGKDGKFTPAVCDVRVQKTDPKHTNTIITTKSYDSCEDHVGHFVGMAWKNNHLDGAFHAIVVNPFKENK